MLLARHFTFPLAVRASVASDGIIKSTAPTHRAITQHHDMSVVGVHAVQKRCLSLIKSIPNHDLMPRNRELRQGPATAQTKLRVLQRLYKPWQRLNRSINCSKGNVRIGLTEKNSVRSAVGTVIADRPPGCRRRSPAPGSHRTWRADFPHHALRQLVRSFIVARGADKEDRVAAWTD